MLRRKKCVFWEVNKLSGRNEKKNFFANEIIQIILTIVSNVTGVKSSEMSLVMSVINHACNINIPFVIQAAIQVDAFDFIDVKKL